MIPVIIAIVGTALVSGGVTYWLSKPSNSHATSGNANTTGEILNNVHVEMGMRIDLSNILLMILISLKLIEVMIYAFNSYRKALKKKFHKRQEANAARAALAALTTAQQQQQQRPAVPAQV